MTLRYEFLVRPAVLGPVRSPATLPQIRRPPGATGEAVHRWGRAAGFDFSAPSQPTTQVNFDDLPDIDEPDADGLIFTETDREVEVVRITQEGNAQNWVDVERIKRISFRGEDGIIRTFVLNN